ncbi:hypothetical protein ACQK5W_04080 [Pantoea sp. FN060301]|uniref:hypothetical protein n=1 Tax=Pantoea sp. FN060301 TaxID=3420380 RepID=UPI003D16D1EB
MTSKIEETFNKLKPLGVFIRPLSQFSCKVEYKQRGDFYRVSVDIPASEISESRDVRAMFGDGDCKLIPTLAFIDND